MTTTDPQSCTVGFDFFLSYRGRDAAQVQPLVDELRVRLPVSADQRLPRGSDRSGHH